DPDFQRAAATRLPVPVISSHVTLAIGGLVVWVVYLLTDDEILAWVTLADLAIVVTLGLTIAGRWISVYRSRELPESGPAMQAGGREPFWASGQLDGPEAVRAAGTQGALARTTGARLRSELAVPPERHFPVSVVIGHGVFALTTV